MIGKELTDTGQMKTHYLRTSTHAYYSFASQNILLEMETNPKEGTS